MNTLGLIVVVIGFLLFAGLAWIEHVHHRDQRRIAAMRDEPSRAIAALDDYETQLAVRVYPRGSLGPYPERKPGPGRLRRGRAYRARLIVETEAQLRVAARDHQ